MITFILTTSGGWELANSSRLAMIVAQALALRARGYPTFIRFGDEYAEIHADDHVTGTASLTASVTAVIGTLRQGAA